MRLPTFLSLALLVLPAHSAPIDSELVIPNLLDPIELTVAPDGDVYVIEREGRVLRYRPSTGGLFEIAQFTVSALRAGNTDSPYGREDGMLGITLDPKFATNHQLFVFYSTPEKMFDRLSRFTLKDGKIDLTSEKVLLEVPVDRKDRVCHHGGSLSFGPDGLLYLSTGDNTKPFDSDGYAPQDEREEHEHANSMRSAGNTNDLRGKVLRIRPTATGYEIPKGNLFPPGTAKTRPEIYVMGCRNPYRLSIDPKNNVLYWGEVGPDAADESPKGPRGLDEVNQAKKAGNFGWPFVIGDNKPYPITDFATGQPGAMTDPAAPKNPSRLNTGLTNLPPAQKAFIWYPYAASTEFPSLGSGGRSAMAGPVFYYKTGRKYNFLDKEDDHSLLVYDWMRGGIWKAKLGNNQELVKLDQVMGGLKHPIDLEMAADGSLWAIETGSNWWLNTDGTLRRLRPSTREEPTPAIAVKAVDGVTGTFEASVPDGLEIHWWLTEGASERMIGTTKRITLPKTKASELRAVAASKSGRVAVARVPLIEVKKEPALVLDLPGSPTSVGFAESLSFQIKADPSPAAEGVVVRARYIPPTGHDAGGPQFTSDQEKFITSKQCLACHQVDKPSVGPKYLDVSMKYRDRGDAIAVLTAKLKSGGAGVWGQVPMPAQAAVDPTEAETLIKAILALSDGINESRGLLSGSVKLPPAPASAQPGGAWEISVEAPGYQPARQRLQAK